MRRKITAQIFIVAVPAVCLATNPPPYAGQCSVLDQILSTARSQSQASTAALELLERVAKGQTAGISSELEVRVGVAPGLFGQKEFGEPEVRACALRRIGESGLPRAVDFLTQFKRSDAGADTSQQVWPAARIALRIALLNRIVDPYAKIEFLEKEATEPDDAISNSAVQSWAVNQLCDRGAVGSLSVIQRSIRNRLNGQEDEDEIRFCEARIDVLSRNPDRIKALATVLNVHNNVPNDRLIRWAIQQLDSLHAPAADAELDRFANEIGRLPEDSPARKRLAGFREEIRLVQAARRTRPK